MQLADSFRQYLRFQRRLRGCLSGQLTESRVLSGLQLLSAVFRLCSVGFHILWHLGCECLGDFSFHSFYLIDFRLMRLGCNQLLLWCLLLLQQLPRASLRWGLFSLGLLILLSGMINRFILLDSLCESNFFGAVTIYLQLVMDGHWAML